MSDHEKVPGYSGQEVLTEGLPAENGEGASVPPSPEADEASFRETFFKLWQERSFIAKVSLAGLALATVLAFVIPPRYESTTRLMPWGSVKCDDFVPIDFLASPLGFGEMKLRHDQ